MEFTAGKLGELFVSLAFASALVSMISLLIADRREGLDKRSWEKLGMGAFLTHAGSVFGIIITLFILIYTHQYQYHYVWSHSSNELPVHFMISCFWEGQEGSFLLWCFWHSVLGLIVMRKKTEWRNSVLAIMASVEIILTSMLLGVFVSEWVITLGFALMVILPLVYLGWRFVGQRSSLGEQNKTFILGSLVMGLMVSYLLGAGQMGFWTDFAWSGFFDSIDSVAFGLAFVFLLGYGVLFLVKIYHESQQTGYALGDILAGASLFTIGIVAFVFEPEVWKLGSTPFLTLKAAFPNEAVYITNPDFVPTNGSGLNSLLQNYWMVIHPPTLFLGFASSVVPFAFVMSGLIKGKYDQWIKPALPWMSFSVMILGIGIIMGGYWAYETLNFGGYWNWDPVENSSLVPWLCGVASLHAMLIYQKAKAYLKLTMMLISGTFLLVLYSTFLTRSGILGDSSVHTFTDLGLSGQLLILLMLYVAAVVVLMMLRSPRIPQREDESELWSAEFMLFLGVLIFGFSGLVVIMATSLPVVNSIFGTQLAPPAQVQFFYYQWNVWFAILFGIVSGVGQFLWWKIKRGKSLSDAIFRPFLMAMVAGTAITAALLFSNWTFAYDGKFANWIDPEMVGTGFLDKAIAYLKYGVMSVADELLLFSALFGLAANVDVLFSILSKNRKGLKVMGGTVVHIGFALMLLGILFSSGYDQVLSTNLFPSQMAPFMNEQERVDNVRVNKTEPTLIKEFAVQYLGKKDALPPVSKLEIIEENGQWFKLRFQDARGDDYVIVQRREPFLIDGSIHAVQEHEGHNHEGSEGEIDMEMLEKMLNTNLLAFEPELSNNRSQYGLQFTSLKDSTEEFVLYPEAEVNEDMQSIISHPSRRIYWNRDIYVYTSSLPSPEASKPKFFNFGIKPGERVQLGEAEVLLAEVQNITGQENVKQYDVAAVANLFVITPTDTFLVQPVFTIEDRKPGMIADEIPELGLEVAFVGVDPESGIMQMQARQVNPGNDHV
ncbi:MAG: cytochrome c biogenesis protein CcsA, partial [Bacteroidia bacterium]|nr:cytochrome c biogenesis protein CcsA [Bacteroidia bacterium]